MKLAVALMVAAGAFCGLVGREAFPRTIVKTHVVHVTDRRPLIRPGASIAEVRANFGSRPYVTLPADGTGFRCHDYMQNQEHTSKTVGAWVIRFCAIEVTQ